MFLGEYLLKFTGQGRIVLPIKFRDELSGESKIILSRGLDGCIWGFSREFWEKEAKTQIAVSVTDQRGRDLRRYFFSASVEVDLDKQGRFVITKNLLDYAHIKDEVILVGAGDHFEIWNPRKWRKWMKGTFK